jgi:hypothetical protein
MATVYLARDLRHDRPAALKVLHPELAVTLGPERFRRPPPPMLSVPPGGDETIALRVAEGLRPCHTIGEGLSAEV